VAFLTVLWVLTLVSTAAAMALSMTRIGSDTSRNRLLLLRAAWAREACVEILLARYAERALIAETERVDLGRKTWCRATVEDAATKLDVNKVPPEMLRAILGSDSLTDALLDWLDPDDVPRRHGAELSWYRSRGRRPPRNGPLADVAELALVAWFDSATVAALHPRLTVRGPERININMAPPGVLVALPGLRPEAVSLILHRRALKRSIESTDELLSLLSEAARQTLASQYQQFTRYAEFAASQVAVRVEGGVTGATPTSVSRLSVVPVPGRLAVIRREPR
jgi:type II secretory pathway component PulK